MKKRDKIKAKFGGKCAYCGIELPEKGWHVDHLEPVIRDFKFVPKGDNSGIYVAKQTGKVFKPENENFDNLFPSCAPCNLLKSSCGLESFRYVVSEQMNRALRYSVNARTALRFNQFTINETPILFHFEKFKAKELETNPYEG